MARSCRLLLFRQFWFRLFGLDLDVYHDFPFNNRTHFEHDPYNILAQLKGLESLATLSVTVCLQSRLIRNICLLEGNLFISAAGRLTDVTYVQKENVIQRSYSSARIHPDIQSRNPYFPRFIRQPFALVARS